MTLIRAKISVNEAKYDAGKVSMTESGDPLENAVAERTNGIIKREWLYRMQIDNIESCHSIISRIIDFYNQDRPHMSIG